MYKVDMEWLNRLGVPSDLRLQREHNNLGLDLMGPVVVEWGALA